MDYDFIVNFFKMIKHSLKMIKKFAQYENCYIFVVRNKLTINIYNYEQV